ncbi:MAG: hypothetical protein AAB965_04115 [Patescibacteria group bacterium]
MKNKPIRIVAFVGPSGTGKSTIVRRLLKKFSFMTLITSLTTRKPRDSDIKITRRRIREYLYMSDDDFDKMISLNAFEWFVGPHGNRYGTPKDLLDKAAFGHNEAILGKKFSIMIVTPLAAEKLFKLYPEITLFFFVCPVARAEIERRLVLRGDTKEAVERRVKDCEDWFKNSLESLVPYIYLKNDGPIEKTLAIVESYFI